MTALLLAVAAERLHDGEAVFGVAAEQFQEHEANRPPFRSGAGFDGGPQAAVDVPQGVFGDRFRHVSTMPRLSVANGRGSHFLDHSTLSMPSPDRLLRPLAASDKDSAASKPEPPPVLQRWLDIVAAAIVDELDAPKPLPALTEQAS